MYSLVIAVITTGVTIVDVVTIIIAKGQGIPNSGCAITIVLTIAEPKNRQ